MLFTFFAPFFIGLSSTLHCVGMCGGIIGALSMGLPAEIRQQPRKMFSYVAAYNCGRLLSYAMAGALMGTVGSMVIELAIPKYGHSLLQVLAAMLIIGTGLYLAGWFPAFVRIEKLGQPIWRRLEPIGQRLFPITKHRHALLLGLVWGWLPCGLVYTALLMASTSGGAWQGALLMTLFGAGTLPGVMAMGMLSGWMMKMRQQPRLRQLLGGLLIVMGILSLYPLTLLNTHVHHMQ